MLYSIFNQGEVTCAPCGRCTVIAIKPGYKWITLIDWTTLETSKVSIAVWKQLKPVPSKYNPKKVRKIIKQKLAGEKPTANIKLAISSLGL